jgi:hypothetical protein
LAEFNWTSNAPKVTFLHERLPDDYLTIAPSVLKVRKEVAMEKLAHVKISLPNRNAEAFSSCAISDKKPRNVVIVIIAVP